MDGFKAEGAAGFFGEGYGGDAVSAGGADDFFAGGFGFPSYPFCSDCFVGLDGS